MSGNRALGLAVAIAAGIGVAACAKFGGGTGSVRGHDKDTTIKLGGDPCVVMSKEAEIHVGKGKKVTWTIDNGCTKAQVVVIGNFRDSSSTTVTNCKAGLVEPTWPFKDPDETRKMAWVAGNGTTNIVLKEAKNDTGNALEFFYDVCVEGKISDPKMIVDPT